MLLRATAPGNDFAVRGLPQPDQAGFFAEHDSVDEVDSKYRIRRGALI